PGGGRKPVYSSKLTHLKITHYHSLSNRKIKGIVHTFQNIIHLDFEGSTDCTDKVLKLIAESYPNLEYLNISNLRGEFWPKNDIGLTAIANSCYKLEWCYNISKKTVNQLNPDIHVEDFVETLTPSDLIGVVSSG
ncbi:hypothetical protein RhiirA4_482640, partial [Rhizophagus irregularis]